VDALFAASLVSAPIVNADGSVLGYLDVLDIAGRVFLAVQHAVDRLQPLSSTAGRLPPLSLIRRSFLLTLAPLLSRPFQVCRPKRESADISAVAGTVPSVPSSAPLSALIKAVHGNAAERYQRFAFSDASGTPFYSCCNSVLVVDGGKAVDVVTLSDIITFINSHFGSLGTLVALAGASLVLTLSQGKSSLASLHLAEPAVTVKAKSPVSEAILSIVSHKVPAIPLSPLTFIRS
jgi:hypothetical protein